MRIFIWGIALLLSIFASDISQAQQLPSDAELKAAIRRDDSSEFETLYKNPRRAAELLISTLQPVRRGQYPNGKHPLVVWQIRALRSLTGLDFTATTKSGLDTDESHFLDRKRNGEVRFFGTWMSRDRVWVAPVDAQTAIIGKWRAWLAKNGSTFTYVNDRNFDHWYF
jgi:hypothetical protein